MSSLKSDKVVYDSESGSEYEDKAFEPPKHFRKIAIPTPQTTAQNKEIWLIKTPRGFPVSELKTLPVSFTATKVKNDGVKPFKVQNSDFQVNEEHFSADTAKYHIVNNELLNKKIDRFFTIREVVRVPEINYDVMVEPRKDVEKATDLRMRHFATGYAAKDFKEAHPIPEPRLDADGKVVKRAKVAIENSEQKEDEESKDKKEKKEKKDKKDKKEKKDKKDKKKKDKSKKKD